jgi:hypothetical protein
MPLIICCYEIMPLFFSLFSAVSLLLSAAVSPAKGQDFQMIGKTRGNFPCDTSPGLWGG